MNNIDTAQKQKLEVILNVLNENEYYPDGKSMEEWFLWKAIHELRSRIWNYLGCPEQK